MEKEISREIVVSPEIARAITNDYIHLIVNPTERCNLRCVYCYETFSIGKMPRTVISGIVELVKRRVSCGLEALKLELFGGEPLVAWDVVEELSGNISELCLASGTSFYGSITTNGVLLFPDRIQKLTQCGINSYQITLDGPQSIHDGRRISRGGKGSYEAVWQALHALKTMSGPVEVLVRMHFDPTTVTHLVGEDGFISDVVASLLRGDDRFRMHFHAVGRWGGPGDHKTVVAANAWEERQAISRLVQTALQAGCRPEQLLQSSADALLGEAGHEICYAAAANAFVIRADGRVAKCTVALEDERNTIGRLTERGDLVIDHSRHLPWLQGLLSGDPTFLSCPAKAYLWRKQ